MPNAPRTWPWPAQRDEGAIDPSFGLQSLLEAQMRLWNHMLDANRSFWQFYTPWLPPSGWELNPAAESDDETEVRPEPEMTVDGIPDPLEIQTRSWNHFLDAQRSFWSSLDWPAPPTAWTTAANEDAPSEAEADDDIIAAEARSARTKTAPAKKPRTVAAAKSKRSTRAARAR